MGLVTCYNKRTMEKTFALDQKQLFVLAFVVAGLIVGRQFLDRPVVQPTVISWETAKPVVVTPAKGLSPATVAVAEKVAPPTLAPPLPLCPPSIKVQLPPAYPAAALKQGIEGTVLVAAYVVGVGRPAKVELQASSGNELLDQAALQAVAEWEFLPATQGGADLASYLDIPVVFQII